jgi:hypothetical protein
MREIHQADIVRQGHGPQRFLYCEMLDAVDPHPAALAVE